MRTSIHSALAVLVLAALGAPSPAQQVYGGQRRVGSNYDQLLRYWIDNYGLVDPSAPVAQSAGPSVFGFELLAKAPKDECYGGIGAGLTELPPNCPQGAVEKANQTYVWGMEFDQATNTLWFGSGANVPCTARGNSSTTPNPTEDVDSVCEFGSSALVQQLPFWPPGLGDFRPPHIYSLDVSSALGAAPVDHTAALAAANPALHNTTLGFRGVGVHNGVVLFGGPAISFTNGGINLFAFRTDGTYLGGTTLIQYSNLRKFLVVDGVMYLGVLNSTLNPFPGGSVLRWTGNAQNPFQFQVVGRVDNEVSELAVHELTNSLGVTEKRLLGTTWPQSLFTNVPFSDADGRAAVFASPPIPPGGLTLLHQNGWTAVWTADDYEPDPVTARAYGGGAIASFDGWVYWGTLHQQNSGRSAWTDQYGPAPSQQVSQAVRAGTNRMLALFRGRLGADSSGVHFDQVELLYGLRQLPVYDPATQTFSPRPNLTGPPLSGLAGLNNMYNIYTWTMEVSGGLLYVGTYDRSYQEFGVGSPVSPPPGQLPSEFRWIGDRNWGSDLWVIAPGSGRARMVQTRGFGNDTNFGVRTMVSANGLLYCGTANASTLNPKGGWELVRVIPPHN